MTKFSINHANAAFRICVDQIQESQISGRIFSQRLIAPILFNDISDLLLQTEEILDIQNFPQAFECTRTFNKKKQKQSFAALNTETGMDAKTVSDAAGAIITFDIFVITRCHSTWQGYIDWLDNTKPQKFDSDLDLIHLAVTRIFH